MSKTAQYPYDQVSLAPGLPQEIEQESYASGTAPDSGSGAPDWALPAGATAAGLLGYLLLRGRGGRAAKQLAQKGTPAVESALKLTPGGSESIAEQAISKLTPIEAWSMGRPELTSKLYPGQIMGTHAGEYAQQVMGEHSNPQRLINMLKKRKELSFLPEGRDPRALIKHLSQIAKDAK